MINKSLFSLKNVLNLSTRTLPPLLGLKMRKVLLAHYRLISHKVPSDHVYTLTFALEKNLTSKNDKEEVNRKFFIQYVELEYDFLMYLVNIAKDCKAILSERIRYDNKFDDRSFFGAKWKEEIERVNKDIGITLPTFANYELYGPIINFFTKKDKSFMSIFDDTFILDAADTYLNYQYAFDKLNKL